MGKTRYTLLEMNNMIGEAIYGAFTGSYWLVAEINEIREAANGHCYLELTEKEKNSDNIIARNRATIWAYTWRMLKPYFETSTSKKLGKGMMILVEVTVEFHELYGLSFNIKDIDPVYTIGDLERRRAEILRRLEEEGIINMNRSLEIPALPSRIAVISSQSAAGYEDFTHQMENNPYGYRFSISLFPALMQGSSAARSVTDALDAIFDQEDIFDVVVILRGGGSASDLNCFDSYEIAAHIAQFPLPVITGIGHERDLTIAGTVANTNVKTPTAVAELLIGKYREADALITTLGNRLAAGVSRLINKNRQVTDAFTTSLPVTLKNKIQHYSRGLLAAGSILARSAKGYIQKKHHVLDTSDYRFGIHTKNYLLRLKNREAEIRNQLLPQRIRSMINNRSEKLLLFETTIGLVDPENILKKGYAIVIKDGSIIKSVKQVSFNDILETKMHDGRITSKVSGVYPPRNLKKRP